jgi:hypothetical protein
VDLLLAAILFAAPCPQAEAPTGADPQAAYAEWLQSLPAEHPLPFTQELELDFDLAFEELAGDEEMLGYFESVLPDMDFDLRINVEMLDAQRVAYRLSGCASFTLPTEAEDSISASGHLGLIFDGKRIHGWVDGKESRTDQVLRNGFTFDQATANGLYEELIAMLPEILAQIPKDELPAELEVMQRAMPRTLAEYLHPRGYWRSGIQLFEARSFEVDGSRVRTRVGPNAELAAGLVAGMVADAEEVELAAEQAQQLARAVMDGMEIALEFDRASGMPLDARVRIAFPLELFEAGISGRVVFSMSQRTLAWERKAPAAERFAPPEGIEWFDADTLMPLIRMALDQILDEPDASEEDFEF